MNFQGAGQNTPRNETGTKGTLRARAAGIGRWSAAHPRLSRIVWVGIGLGLLGLVIWAIYPTPAVRTRGFNNAAQPVGVATAKLGDIHVTLNALGTVTPLATATVRPQVSGILIKLDFTEGQMVKAGDALAEIDPRTFQAALDQAKGQLARDSATLANDRVLAADQEGLAQTNATSKEALNSAQSAVRSMEGVVQSDQANVETAQINLGYTRVVAPVSGRAGLHMVDVGNFVSAGQTTGIVVVTQIQPMSVLFSVPEDNVGAILARVNGGASLDVDAYDRSQTNLIARGTLATVDNVIDPATGSVKLRALFDNSDDKLFPNQFVNVKLLVDTLHDQIVIPVSAIQHGSDGTYVFVVAPDHTANERAVTAGTQDGTMVAITKGLQPGDTVVTDGADRLRDGAEVATPNAAGRIAPPSAASGGDAIAQRRAKAAAAMEQACGADIKKYCAGETGRGQRTCLMQHRGDLSAVCTAQVARGRGGRRGGGGFGGAP